MGGNQLLMGGNRLLVRWERHASGVLAHLRRLLAAEAFVDVTLCCQGRRLRAHRVLLSACSPYLQRILLEHPCGAGESVTVILHDVSHEDMRRLLDLMYTGSTEVPGHDLSRFLCTAKALDVSLLRSAALQICEVATSPAEPDRQPTPATTPAVAPSLRKTPPDSVAPSPKEPSQWPLMAPQLRSTDPAVHWQQAPHTGPPMLPLACRSPLMPPSPPPTMAQSSNQAAGELASQEQLLRERHVCTPPPNVTFVSKSPGTASMSRHVQPKQQHEASRASSTCQHVQEEDSFRLKRLMGVVHADKKTRPETNNINRSSRSVSGKPCGAKAVTSLQQLQQHQSDAPVEHQPPPSPPPLCIPPQQSDHLNPAVPPLPQSQPLPTAPSHSLLPSKLPAHFQELKQPNPQQMQLPRRRRQQPRDLPESSQRPEDPPANPTLSCEAATELQRNYECEDCSKLFATKASLKVCSLFCWTSPFCE
ncbi:proline-rich protein 36-like [Schistocerca serialis cubense]|uniref:proline-rich protein 36-like n=1 Tax=Schistocerca serialis cubense TaxID=2023355 RepID=UPI00214E5A98|nr:proline-rich protein 36-like [Schistocerca serialis cubense]